MNGSRKERSISGLQSPEQFGPAFPEAEELESGEYQGVMDFPASHAGLPFGPGERPDLQFLRRIQLQGSLGVTVQGQKGMAAVVLGGGIGGAGAQGHPM